MAYEQAQIPVQKVAEFEELHTAIQRIFGSDALKKFYGLLESKGISAREFEKVLKGQLLETADTEFGGSGKSAEGLYGALSQSDQALMREFYLERIEQVDPGVRLKFRRVYEYR